MTLNGSAYTIVGVAPPQFVGADSRTGAGGLGADGAAAGSATADCWFARSLGSADLLAARGPRWLSAVARLKPGSDLAQTAAGLDVVARRLQAAYPETNATRAFNAVPLGEGPGVRASSRPLLRLLGAAVAARSSHRMCQRRESAPRAQRVPTPRGSGANGRRRWTLAPRSPMVDRVRAAFAARRPRRRRARQLGSAAAPHRRHSGNRQPRCERASARLRLARSPPAAGSCSGLRQFCRLSRQTRFPRCATREVPSPAGDWRPGCGGRSWCSRSR